MPEGRNNGCLNPKAKAKPFAAGGKRFRRCSGESVLGSTANGTHGLRGDDACLETRSDPERLSSVVADYINATGIDSNKALNLDSLGGSHETESPFIFLQFLFLFIFVAFLLHFGSFFVALLWHVVHVCSFSFLFLFIFVHLCCIVVACCSCLFLFVSFCSFCSFSFIFVGFLSFFLSFFPPACR